MSDPRVHGNPTAASRSLNAIGSPCSGPTSSPLASRWSAASASARHAASSSFATIALRQGLSRSIWPRCAAITGNRALRDEVVELRHFGAAVRLAGAEADGTKDPRDIGRVVFLEPLLLEGAAIDEPSQGEHADHVGLGFFQPGERPGHRLA